MTRAPLPIDDVLPDIQSALESETRLVLAAPPGAGKTTRVPLELLGAGWRGDGKLILLEPRRIAARMAAERMAATLGQRVGQTVGLRTRLDTRTSAATRIEVVTEGVFTRMALSDPSLDGIAAVLFDEIHERALTADLGLALALDVQSALREDLRVILMSATLDTAKLKDRLSARVIESEGRAFPVETRYLGRDRDERVEDAMARAVRRALREETGSILCFLPGQGEILRTAERLSDLPADVHVTPLYGALSPQEQDAAIRPAAPGTRKVVLATDLAESSLTIEGVRVVIDAGLARVPETIASTGLTRLVTQRAARANVDQRRGRAGRTEPGVCYRLWHEEETRGLAPAPTPEILTADLSGLVLDLAAWGERDPARLTWIDPPPAGRIKAALSLLSEFGAIDAEGTLTDRGRALAALPLPPRLGMLIASADSPDARKLGAELAVLASERGAGGSSMDVNVRLAQLRKASGPQADRHRRLAAAWATLLPPLGTTSTPPPLPPAAHLIRAWPGRVAKARDREAQPGLYLLASGQAARIEATDSLAKKDWLAVLDLAGSGKEARITAATALDESIALQHAEIAEVSSFDPATGRVTARRLKRLGAIILSDTPLPATRGEAVKSAILNALKEHGFSILPARDAVTETLARIALVRRNFGDPWPEWTEADLLDSLDDWFAPLLDQAHKLDSITENQLTQAIANHLGWPLSRDLDTLAPRRFTAPTGSSFSIDYSSENAPLVALRVQEVYGLAQHPAICDGRQPLTLSLLSPAHREIAITRDLPGFWSGGYLDMRKDMRGRYPKHDWPENPANTAAHTGRVRRKP